MNYQALFNDLQVIALLGIFLYSAIIVIDIFLALLWYVLSKSIVDKTPINLKETWNNLLKLISMWITTHILPICVLMNVVCILWVHYFGWFYIPYFTFCFLRPWDEDKASEKIRGWFIWEYASSYLPCNLSSINEGKKRYLPSGKPLLIGYHPHGIFSLGCILNFGCGSSISTMFPGMNIRVATLSSLFKMPFLSDFLFSMGAIPADAESIKNFLQKDKTNAVVIVVGGAREAEVGDSCNHCLILKSRSGFFRIGLQVGANFLPVYAFGEDLLYYRPTIITKLLFPLSFISRKVFGFSLPIFFGEGFFQKYVGLLPHKIPVDIVFGNLLRCPTIEQPNRSDIEKVRSKYCRQVTKIFESHKTNYYENPEEEKLYFVS